MKWFLLNIPLAIIVVTQCELSKAAEIKDHFAKDFPVNSSSAITYSRNFNQRHEFGYIACDLRKICDFHVIHADSKQYLDRKCSLRGDLLPGDTGKIAMFLPNNGNYDCESIVQAWWVKGPRDTDARVTNLLMQSCITEKYVIIPVSNKPNMTRVVPYYQSYPKFSVIYMDTVHHDRHMEDVTLRGYGGRNDWSLGATQKHLFGEKGIEINGTYGFFFMETNGDPDWAITVVYSNDTHHQVHKIDVINDVNDPTMTYPKASGAHNKYGLCWKKSGQDNMVSCEQFMTNGQKSMNEVTIELPESFDWLALHNLKEAALMLVTGTCDGEKCDRYNVTRVDANGQHKIILQESNLNATCQNVPKDLSMDVVESEPNQEICFNFVCQATENNITSLQYRRNCYNINLVDNDA